LASPLAQEAGGRQLHRAPSAFAALRHEVVACLNMIQSFAASVPVSCEPWGNHRRIAPRSLLLPAGFGRSTL